MIDNPSMTNTDELYMPSILDGPMRIQEMLRIKYPIIMTPLLLIREVIMYTRGLVEAYISVGIAKLKPINTA